ncbi:MAG TPA: glycosyl hydrolase, partial [Candidatus Hydrogenedentes bacterium]|nr:glycosyl hydrolase [Candidatus Hydrogenedentota bacterium]
MSPRIILLTLLLAALALPAVADDLEAAFTNPPDSTKLRCYWYWMDGHISKEGLTKDLEAMRDFGIGEAYIGIISGQSGLDPKPEPLALSDGWWDAIVHAFREGSRLGVDLGFFNSPGWSQSGGPWVTPDKAMRYVSLPETRITGPQRFEGKLPAPDGPFQDIAVLAYPAPQGEGVAAPEKSRTPRAVD